MKQAKLKCKLPIREAGINYKVGDIMIVSEERAKAFADDAVEFIGLVEESVPEAKDMSKAEMTDKNIKRGKRK